MSEANNMSKEAMKLALEDYLSREMPAGTVIGDPKWWAGKIANVLAKQEQGEPVATICITQEGSTRTIDNHFADCVRDWPDGEYKLYITPQQRKPLTDETRNWIVATCPTPRHIIDAVERMHCIKE